MILESAKKKYSIKSFNSFEFNNYLFVTIIFLIGVLFGCIYFRMIINDTNIKQDIIDKFNNLENVNDIEKVDVFFESSLKNIKLLIMLWIVGVSAIGSPFLLYLCFYKGFSIAFTISSILISLGFENGNIFVFKSMYIYLLFSVLVLIILTVSSIKVSLNIFKNKKDIRLEIIRHSILSFFCIFLLLISTILETIANVKI